MTRELERIRLFLEQLGRQEVLARLVPGRSGSEVAERLEAVGLDPVADVQELYSWRNGTRVEAGTDLDSVHLFPGFYLLSLDDAVRNYIAFRDDPRWDPAWLPVFANGGGDSYAADTGENPSPVIGFMIDQVDHPIEYESLGSMIKTLAEAFGEGVFFVDDRGYLEMDDRRLATIARRNNPGVPLWSRQ